MGTGKSGLYNISPAYNSAGSKNVKKVYTVSKLNNAHTLPQKSIPNSVSQNFENGKLISERYFDEKGEPYLDIDYTDHGNPKMHPYVPHEHSINTYDGIFERVKKGRAIK